MEIKNWGSATVISLGLHSVILYALLKTSPKAEIKTQKGSVLKTYIVSFEKQKQLLKKDVEQEVKSPDKNIKNRDLKSEKVIKKKVSQIINKDKPKLEINQKAGESNTNKVKTFKKLNPYSGLNSIISQEHNAFVDSKSAISGKLHTGRITVPKEHQKKFKSEVLVQSATSKIFKQDGKCFIEVFGSQMSKLGMPSGQVPCPGEKSANEAAYAAAMDKWLGYKH